MIPTIPAPWRLAGSAAIEYQALVLPLDQGDSGVVRPGVCLWLASELNAALGAITSTVLTKSAPAGMLADHLLALLPEGDFRSTDRVRLTSVYGVGEDRVFAFRVEHALDLDGDPAPARLCVLLQLAADEHPPPSLRFEFVIKTPAAQSGALPAAAQEVVCLSLRLF